MSYLRYALTTVLAEFIAVVLGIMPAMMLIGPRPTNFPFALLTGLIIGWRHAKKSVLPTESFSLLFWPLIALNLCVLTLAICGNFYTANANFRFNMILLSGFTYGCVPFVIAFIASAASRGKPMKNVKFIIPPCALIAVLLAVFWLQAKQNNDVTFTDPYAGSTVADDVNLYVYSPANEDNRLASLDVRPSLRINENYPTADGATAFFPIYAAILNEVYETGDKREILNYLACSRTPEAYDRLIAGKVDVIFALQPSDGQLAAARKAGVEMSFTPIAKDAFVFFVNNVNPVSDLSVDWIQDIYTKKITNWGQIGGNDIKILPFQRPDGSGSQTTMLKEVMRGKAIAPPLRDEYQGHMGGMVRGVAIYRDYAESIGYSFRFFTNKMVYFTPYIDYHRKRQERLTWNSFRQLLDIYERIERIEGDDRERWRRNESAIKILSVDGVAPTNKNILNGTYPFAVEIYAVTAGTENPNVQELIDWIISPEGQELVEKTGYVGVGGKF